ncbi:hypothetical protein ASPWEDRAFT_49331 [Aspergillus wentii DTO 134E9]|uniref:N-acetyltransferase domain-containing protein n=1 Tax=Aspergillus wentii DTO 134E9 TaxID=1073089 RepID=A0A1L9RWL1_ASPWE|nr:uncharacterized protein ASPWEDRAFT_49331 [Aspergillus wentii DTO 134E9]KAI9929000.1 hypothetical protein MW887_001393 [Aspergillus wentii]OJJ39312.1 hypothetical protein ASPWEDRAFT_49331 [Aspergillus wentii DTO 134E9]
MPPSEVQKKVGQLFAVGFHGLTPSPEIKTLIHDYGVGGIILFKRNVRDAAQLQALTLALQNEARIAGHEHPLFIGIDQENGLVTRISPPIAAQLPGPMALGATHSPELAYQVGKVTGETLGFFGINMNYAPVCDINSEPLNPVIGVRSPGDDPEIVGRFASATARGLREQNVVPSVKHFPGHGDTAVDSHYGLPVVPKTRNDLERCELIPFRRAVAEGVEAVMTAHIALPAIGDGQLPATLSPGALNILRKDMKYDGMVITDCLEMDGIRATYGTERGSVLALNAGSDSIMICHTYSVQVASIKEVDQAVQSGTMPSSRLDEAYRRVTKLKGNLLSWGTALQPRDMETLVSLNRKGSQLAKEAYSRSVTLVRSKPNVLPLSKSSTLVFLFPGAKTPAGGAVDGEGLGRKGSYNATEFVDILRPHNQSVVEIRYGTAGLSTEEWGLVDAADAVIFVSINARESPYQSSLGQELPKHTRALVTVAASNPYDFLEDESLETYITTYEPTIEAFTAALDVMFGSTVTKGTLPVGPGKTAQSPISISSFDAANDLEQLAIVWNAALPSYPLSKETLQRLVVRPSGHHFVARVGSTVVGFCLAYTTVNRGKISGQLAVLAVDPKYQSQGVGTRLLTETRSWLRNHLNLNNLIVGSAFPRFWPAIPRDLPQEVQEFFIHRGFRLNPPVPRSVDLYQDIVNFQAPEKYIVRARELGYTFAPLQPEHYEECIAAQERNFSSYTGWVEAYVALNPKNCPSSVMVAFDPQGKQVAWTLMLPPSSPLLERDWAFPPLCGPKTGLIGCVGVDSAYRKGGIGLALLCHAIEDMKQRGIEGVFVDWVSLDGWYEQVGFKVWRSYRTGEI